MSRLLRNVLISTVAFIFTFPPFFNVYAQAATEISINLISKLEKPNEMVLKVYFTLVDDRTNQPVLNAEYSSAQITLINRNFVSDAEIKQPDVPIYVTMVLDSSGSMAQAAEILRQAAKLALNNIPADAQFGVVQFDEQIQLLQDFTDNVSAVSFAIDQYKVSNRGTCLYDAAYTAVEALEKAPPGRRAVILFTDGKDEKRDGSICSQHNYQELIKLANEKQVPVHTIGLSDKDSKINTAELQSMAATTGGFSAIASQADLAQSFNLIMDALKAQRMAEAIVYPRSGANDALLKLVMKDNTSLNVAFVVESQTDYPGPPSPVTAKFAGLQYKADAQTYDVQISLTSPELVAYIKVSVWDQDAGLKVGEYVFNDPVANNVLTLPTDKMTPGKKFDLRMIAVSRDDNTPLKAFPSDRGEMTDELVHEFEYNPAFPTVELRSVVQLENDIVLTVGASEVQLIDHYEGWLVDENTNTQVPNSNFSVTSLAADGTIRVPLFENKVPDGKYKVVVRVIGKEGQEYAKAEYAGVVYQAERPNRIQILISALITNPIILFSIVGIIILVIAIIFFGSMREKSLTGTPVMQGRLGGKVKGGKAGGSLPLADEEPLQAPAASRPPAPTPLSKPVSQPAQPQVTPPTFSPASGEETMITGPADVGGATMVGARHAAAPVLTITRSAPGASLIGRKVPVQSFPFTIGRTTGDLVIQDGSISRQHAQITFDQARQAYFLVDLNSSNGTRLNGTPLTAGQPYPLNSGASIELGPNVSLNFELA